MKTIIIRTQAEFDTLPAKFDDYAVVEIRSAGDFWLTVKKCPESSQVEARGSSQVVAWGSSRVVARESSQVEAWGSSQVVAWGSSQVVAWGSSQVEARESSQVVAWGSSRVVARGSSCVHAHGDAPVNLFMFAVCFLMTKTAKAIKKSKTATIITPKHSDGVGGWLESQGIPAAVSVTLFKRVSKDFKTQEGLSGETSWTIGAALRVPEWSPEKEECGAGKFHACSRPYFCDEFRDRPGDRYIAIKIAKKDLYAWPSPSYPHKIAFRRGTVIYECDRFGERVGAK